MLWPWQRLAKVSCQASWESMLVYCVGMWFYIDSSFRWLTKANDRFSLHLKRWCPHYIALTLDNWITSLPPWDNSTVFGPCSYFVQPGHHESMMHSIHVRQCPFNLANLFVHEVAANKWWPWLHSTDTIEHWLPPSRSAPGILVHPLTPRRSTGTNYPEMQRVHFLSSLSPAGL